VACRWTTVERRASALAQAWRVEDMLGKPLGAPRDATIEEFAAKSFTICTRCGGSTISSLICGEV
jgi:hypothetical protein